MLFLKRNVRCLQAHCYRCGRWLFFVFLLSAAGAGRKKPPVSGAPRVSRKGMIVFMSELKRADDTQSMEDVLRVLLSADADAQETVHENEQRRMRVADIVSEAQEKMREDYGKRAQKRIEEVRSLHRADYEEDLRRMQESYQKSLDSLGRICRERQDEWVDTLVRRCLD